MSFSPTLCRTPSPIPVFPASDASPTRAAPPARGRSLAPLRGVRVAPLRGIGFGGGTIPATLS